MYKTVIILLATVATCNASVTRTEYFNGHTYYLLAESNWVNAETEAVSLGGHLITISTEAEQQWFDDTFIDKGLPPAQQLHIWIGINDIEEEGNWRWVSGEPVTYTNWDTNQPGDHPELEEDWGFTTRAYDGRWHDGEVDYPTLRFAGVVEVVPVPAALPAGLVLIGLVALKRTGGCA